MTTDSFNKPAARNWSGGHAWLHAVNAALLVGTWAFAITAYAGLPELVPGHVGPGGVTRWDPKGSSPWFILPAIGLINAVVLYGVSSLSSGTGQGVNVPDRKRFMALPPEGRRYALQPVRGFMYGMATWLLLLLGFMQVEMYRIAHAGPGAEVNHNLMLVVTGIMVALVVVAGLRMNRNIRRRMGEWEMRQADSAAGAA
jgi:uncharacterized membrane protein